MIHDILPGQSIFCNTVTLCNTFIVNHSHETKSKYTDRCTSHIFSTVATPEKSAQTVTAGQSDILCNTKCYMQVREVGNDTEVRR